MNLCFTLGVGVSSRALEIPVSVPGGAGADIQPHLARQARSPREWLSGTSQQSGPWQGLTKQRFSTKQESGVNTWAREQRPSPGPISGSRELPGP